MKKSQKNMLMWAGVILSIIFFLSIGMGSELFSIDSSYQSFVRWNPNLDNCWYYTQVCTTSHSSVVDDSFCSYRTYTKEYKTLDAIDQQINQEYYDGNCGDPVVDPNAVITSPVDIQDATLSYQTISPGDYVKITSSVVAPQTGFYWLEAGSEQTGLMASVRIYDNTCTPSETWYANEKVYLVQGLNTVIFKVYPKNGQNELHVAQVTKCGGSSIETYTLTDKVTVEDVQPSCGDGTCDSGETTSSCVADCPSTAQCSTAADCSFDTECGPTANPALREVACDDGGYGNVCYCRDITGVYTSTCIDDSECASYPGTTCVFSEPNSGMCLDSTGYVQHAYQACNEGKAYWYDSSRTKNDIIEDCTINNGSCTVTNSVEATCVVTADYCGNNAADGSEVCDGTDLKGKNCLTQGFDGGTLSCRSSCSGYVTTNCYNNETTVSDDVCPEGTFDVNKETTLGDFFLTNHYSTDLLATIWGSMAHLFGANDKQTNTLLCAPLKKGVNREDVKSYDMKCSDMQSYLYDEKNPLCTTDDVCEVGASCIKPDSDERTADKTELEIYTVINEARESCSDAFWIKRLKPGDQIEELGVGMCVVDEKTIADYWNDYKGFINDSLGFTGTTGTIVAFLIPLLLLVLLNFLMSPRRR